MADTNTVVFKRAKTKGAHRNRDKPADAVDVAEDSVKDGEEFPIMLATKLKNKTKRVKASSRLSFGGDPEEGDGEVFQVKKSNLSRKLALKPQSSERDLPSTLDQATITPSRGPVYDKAYLSELKASTPSARPPLPAADSYDADISMDVDTLSYQTIDVADTTAGETAIPAESLIRNAKEKRERLRGTAPAEEEFISLSVTRHSDEPAGPHPESRLVREEDELGEGDDEFAEYTSAQERIALGKKSRKREAGKRREEMKEMIADVEDDDETLEWEQEQIRRGGHTASDFVEKPPVKLVYKPAPIPPATPVPTLGPAIARLTDSLSNLTVSHASNAVSMSSLAAERAQLDSREVEMREIISKAEAKRSWFFAFREWVESVATFLDAKYPQLEKLEDEHMSILKEKADIIAKRRQQDDEDDLSIFLGLLPETSQAEVEEVDELGRVVSQANSTAVRKNRRALRTARRARRPPTDEEDGFSTDSSLPPSDELDYREAIRKISADRGNILSDVRAEEFKDPSLGLGKWFGEWRERFADTYTGAWGGLGLVGAWEFWVRLEIVAWNPLEDSRTLDSFDWYSSLYDYSRPGIGTEEAEELGPDGDLVSAMITTAIIPRICKLIDGRAFDPYSAKHVRRIIDFAEEIESSVERTNVKFQLLVKSVVVSFKNAVISTGSLCSPYLTLNNSRFDPESIPARRQYLTRRLKLLQNMAKWMKYADDLFGMGQLAVRLVSDCIMPIARTGWDVGGMELVVKVRSILPAELLPNSVARL